MLFGLNLPVGAAYGSGKGIMANGVKVLVVIQTRRISI